MSAISMEGKLLMMDQERAFKAVSRCIGGNSGYYLTPPSGGAR